MAQQQQHQHKDETIIWQGTTWPAGCFSPLCCSSVHWKITNKRIDYSSGCCGSTEQMVDIRRVTNIEFHRTCMQMLTGRGTLIIHTAESEPILIKSFGMKGTFTRFKEAWLNNKNVLSVV